MNDRPNRIGVAEDGILGRSGVSWILEPAMTEEELQSWSGALIDSKPRASGLAHWSILS
jgi:hypothetical protein